MIKIRSDLQSRTIPHRSPVRELYKDKLPRYIESALYVGIFHDKITPHRLIMGRECLLMKQTNWRVYFGLSCPTSTLVAQISSCIVYSWASVHWNAIGWPSVHWDTTGWPSKFLQGTLGHYWKNLVETAPHWNVTGETLTIAAYTGTPLHTGSVVQTCEYFNIILRMPWIWAPL